MDVDSNTPQCDILGMGNPLLDISSPVSDEFIKEYDIKMASACLAEDKHKSMYEKMTKMPGVEYIAGGATMNTIRVAQWASEKPGNTAYIGCIGQDPFGEKLQQCAKDSGVHAAFMIDPSTETGSCGVCLKDKERALVANLAAANNYKDSHFDAKCVGLAKRARIIYSSGFFLTVSPESMMKAAQITCETGAYYCLNLAAEFIVQFFGEPLGKVIPFCDFIFGNETEAKAYGETNKMADTSPAAVAKHLAALPFSKAGRKRVVIITSGSEKTTLARSDGLFMEVPVVALDKSKIVDVNAAGDAFVGGFLKMINDGEDYLAAIEFGHKCSRYIIQQSGCTFTCPKANTLDQ